MGDLDFKFVVHHGEMVRQKIGAREELAGRDVILVHRLLKNTVSEKVGSVRARGRPPDGRVRADLASYMIALGEGQAAF